MTVNIDDARRAYEAAEELKAYFRTGHPMLHSARLLLTNATQDYAQALVDDAQRRLDAMGIKVGETECVGPNGWPFVITHIEANPARGAYACYVGGTCDVKIITPYTAPKAKELVLRGTVASFQINRCTNLDTHRLTLTGISTADLDGMTGPIVGTFEMVRV